MHSPPPASQIRAVPCMLGFPAKVCSQLPPADGDRRQVIIWLNGAFGAGKTTTAAELAGTMPSARMFDPEMVGYLLMASPHRDPGSPERELLDGTAARVQAAFAQGISRRPGRRHRGPSPPHQIDELEQTARQWRLDHIRDYAAARPWMVASADLVVDSTSLPVTDVARSVLLAIHPPRAPR